MLLDSLASTFYFALLAHAETVGGVFVVSGGNGGAQAHECGPVQLPGDHVEVCRLPARRLIPLL